MIRALLDVTSDMEGRGLQAYEPTIKNIQVQSVEQAIQELQQVLPSLVTAESLSVFAVLGEPREVKAYYTIRSAPGELSNPVVESNDTIVTATLEPAQREYGY